MTEDSPKKNSLAATLAWLLAIPMAATLLSRLADKIPLSDLASVIVSRWREITHIVWIDLFSVLAALIPNRPTDSQLDLLTLMVLMLSVGASAIIREQFESNRRRGQNASGVVPDGPDYVENLGLALSSNPIAMVFTPSVIVVVLLFISTFEFLSALPKPLGLDLSPLASISVAILLGMCADLIVLREKRRRGYVIVVKVLAVAAIFIGAFLVAAPYNSADETSGPALVRGPDFLWLFLAIGFGASLLFVRRFAPLSLARGLAVLFGILIADQLLIWSDPFLQYFYNVIEQTNPPTS